MEPFCKLAAPAVSKSMRSLHFGNGLWLLSLPTLYEIVLAETFMRLTRDQLEVVVMER